MEQGLGLGSGMPFFNRCTGSATRFIKLRDVPEASRSPAPTLVLHARAGHALGDMASYDYFTLGGPFSVCCSTAFMYGALNLSPQLMVKPCDVASQLPVLCVEKFCCQDPPGGYLVFYPEHMVYKLVVLAAKDLRLGMKSLTCRSAGTMWASWQHAGAS